VFANCLLASSLSCEKALPIFCNQDGNGIAVLPNSANVLTLGGAKSPNTRVCKTPSSLNNSDPFAFRYAAGICIVGPKPGNTLAAMFTELKYTGIFTFMPPSCKSLNIHFCKIPSPG